MSEVNQALFYGKAQSYSRNYVISNLLEGMSLGNTRILPCFTRKAHFKILLHRSRLVGDFFISKYDMNVFDRKVAKLWHYRGVKSYFQDWLYFRAAKYLLADTRAHLEYWEALFGKRRAKTHILPVLADHNVYKVRQVTPNDKVLFYGTYIPLHGIEKIIEAAELLKNNGIRFRMIGNGQTYPETRRLVAEKGLDHLFEFVEQKMPEEELAQEINAAKVVLGIFGDSRKARSVVPNKVYQSLACGKCVITMDSVAIREFFSSDHMLLCSNEPADIADTIRRAVEDVALRKAYEAAGLQAYWDLYNRARDDFRTFMHEASLGL